MLQRDAERADLLSSDEIAKDGFIPVRDVAFWDNAPVTMESCTTSVWCEYSSG